MTSIPHTRDHFFSKKILVATARETFLQLGEEVRRNGRGIDRTSLPHLWDDVAFLFKFSLLVRNVLGQYSNILFNYWHIFLMDD